MGDAGRDLAVDDLMRVLRLVLLAIATVLLAGFAVLLVLGDRHPAGWFARQLVAFALLAAVGVVGGVAALRRRPVGRVRWALVAVVFTAAGVATAGVAAEDLLVKAEWCYATVGWFLLLVLIDHSSVAAAAAVGVFTAGSFVQLIVVGQAQDVPDLVVVTTIVLGCELPLIAIATGVRRAVTTAAAATAREEQARTADAVAERVHADRRARYADLDSSTVPLLRALADRTADLSDPSVRTEYVVAATRLRRLLAEHDEVDDPLLHELRACLDVAERRGVDVYLGVCGAYPTPPRPVRRALTEPALRTVAAARDRARVTVLGSSAGVTVSVVADGGSPDPLPDPLPGNEDVAVTTTVDGSRVWVEAAWRSG